MTKDSDNNRESRTGHDPGIFFTSKTPIHEKEMHPQTVISMLKAELRRSQEHVQELYQRIAELKGTTDGN